MFPRRRQIARLDFGGEMYQNWVVGDDLTAADVWLYLFPLVLMNLARSAEPDAKLNQWTHASEYQCENVAALSRFNVDVRYSNVWLDLSNGPVTVSVPTIDDRYYVLQAMDRFGDTFATIGTRTTGSDAQSFTFIGPTTVASTTDGQPIMAKSNHVWLLLRIQDGGSHDTRNVERLQKQFVVHAEPTSVVHSRYLTPQIRQALDTGSSTRELVLQMGADQLIDWACDLLKTEGTPIPAEDRPIIRALATLGIYPGMPLNFSSLSKVQRGALDSARKQAFKKLTTEAARSCGANHRGWFYLSDHYAVSGHQVSMQDPTNYTQRAGFAVESVGMLPLQEASYASAGIPRWGGEEFSGADGAVYRLRFPPDRLPAVDAFWSVTVYDADGWLLPHPDGPQTINSATDVVADADGGITIYFSVEKTGDNWLATPNGVFSIMYRAYSPNLPVSPDGWDLLPVTEVRSAASCGSAPTQVRQLNRLR